MTEYGEQIKELVVGRELYKVRNIRPAFKWGLFGALAYGAIDTFLFGGKAPWTMRHHDDHSQLGDKNAYPKIAYPKPDGKITFDRLSSVFLSATNHEENQQCHLRLKDESVAIAVNYAKYGAPETRYCPAGVIRNPRRGRRQATAADQRPELPALQDLRHQGPDPEHQLDGAGRRQWPNYPNM